MRDPVPHAAADDPVAAYSPLLLRGFTKYLRFYLRAFHGVRIASDGVPRLDPRRPAIIVTNHPSWWDPVVFIFVAAHFFPDRKNFGAMDADALQSYGVMRKLGAFPVPRGPRGAAAFLRASDRILSDPARTLWVTAQGHFADNRAPVDLMPGVAHLARRADADIVPFALDYPFWNERKPECLGRFGPCLAADATLPVSVWAERITDALAGTMAALTADAVSRDASRFVTLVGSRGGVGGPYDLFRRARAYTRGQAFDGSHEA